MNQANPQNFRALEMFARCRAFGRLALVAMVLAALCGPVTAQLALQDQPAPDAEQAEDLGTQAERDWVQRFLSALETGRVDRTLMDDERFVQVVLEPFNLEPRHVQTMSQADVTTHLIAGLQQQLTASGQVAFLRFKVREGQRTALFRITDVTGLSYLEWYIDTDADGQVRAWDGEAYTSGERFSRTIRRLWIPIIGELDPDVQRRMTPRHQQIGEHLGDIMALRNAQLTGNYRQGISTYEAMPDLLQDEVICMMQALMCYLLLDRGEEYNALLERMIDLHGGASHQELLLIDIHFTREDYDGVLELVEALEQRVGGDPYLQMFRANIAYLRGDYESAGTLLDDGLSQDTSMLDFYWVGIDMALQEQDWWRINRMLEGLEANGIELLDLRQVAGYEAYVQSQAYRQWQADRDGDERLQ